VNDERNAMQRRTRRDFIALGGVLAAGTALSPLTGCAGRPGAGGTTPASPTAEPATVASAASWLDFERPLVAAGRDDFDVVVRGCADTVVLRRRTRDVPPGLDLTRVAARMERTMRQAEGVGIAGPQVGLSLRVATLMLDYKTDHPRVIFAVNPLIVERSDETAPGYEGCLSIPGVGGLVRRHSWIRVRHDGPGGEPIEAEAKGYNAVLWQHELDHLEGVLYVDRLQGELLPMDEVRRLRKEQDERDAKPAGSPDEARRSDSLEGACFLVA
jgi:peptide deformylase